MAHPPESVYKLEDDQRDETKAVSHPWRGGDGRGWGSHHPLLVPNYPSASIAEIPDDADEDDPLSRAPQPATETQTCLDEDAVEREFLLGPSPILPTILCRPC